MRFSILSVKLFSCTLLFISSCTKEPDTFDLPYRRDVPVLLATHVSSYDQREIHFSFDLTVFKADRETNVVEEFTGLPDSSFKFEDYTYKDKWVRHIIEKTEYVDTVANSSFLTMFLIDQSISPENFDSVDYYNQRFQAFNAFYRTLNGQGKVIFSSYKRTNTSHEVVEFINTTPSETWNASIAESLLDLTHRQAGSGGLFDALEQAINYVSTLSSDNKSITLFVRNRDDGLSRLNLAGIISLANQYHIKINVIWLTQNYQNVDFPSLRQLPSKTGGFTVYMSSIYQSSTIFLGLAKILKMETQFYRIFVKMTIEDPEYFATRYSTGVFLYYYVSQFYKWSYVPMYFEKP